MTSPGVAARAVAGAGRRRWFGSAAAAQDTTGAAEPAADGADGTAEPLELSGPGADLDFDELYRTKRLAMVRLAILLVDDRASAEDVVQDAFVAVHRNWSGLRDEQAVAAYLRTAVVNTARSALRRRQTARKYLRVADPDEGPPADSELMLAEEHREVLAAVRTLPARQQEVLVLRFWSELSEKEIAQTLGISVGTVKSTASRAMTALERALMGGSR